MGVSGDEVGESVQKVALRGVPPLPSGGISSSEDPVQPLHHDNSARRTLPDLQTPHPAVGGLPLTRSETFQFLSNCPLPSEEAMRRLEYGGFTFTGSPPRPANLYKPGVFPSQDVTFGRDPNEAGYVLTSPGVSRLHAKLSGRNSTYTLTDLNSSNGTFINGTPCTPGREYEVKAYDEISFGTPGSPDGVTWIFVPVTQHHRTVENTFLNEWEKWDLQELNEEQSRVSGSTLKDLLEAKLVRYRAELAAEGTLASTLEAFQGDRHIIDIPKTRELEELLNEALQGEVGDPAEVLIGRSPSHTSLALTLPPGLSGVSRHHLTLTYDRHGDSWSITDHSSNGTTVDGRRLSRSPEPIATGSLITLASDITLRFMPRSTPPLGGSDTAILIGGKLVSIHSSGSYYCFISAEDVVEVLAETPSRSRKARTITVDELTGRSTPGAYSLTVPYHQLPITLHRDNETGRVSLVTQQQAQRSCVHTCTFMLVADALINSRKAESGDALTQLASDVYNGSLAKTEEKAEILNKHHLRGTSFKAVLRPVKEYVTPEALAKLLDSGPVMASGRGQIGGHAILVDKVEPDRQLVTIRDPWHGVKETISWERFVGTCGVVAYCDDSFVQIVPR